MENPIIQTDLAQILNKLDTKIDKLDEKLDTKIDKLDENIDKVIISQTEIKGDIKALDERLSGQINSLDERLSGQISSLDTKSEQLNIRIGNVEFATRAIVIGVVVTVLGGAAMFVYMFSKSLMSFINQTFNQVHTQINLLNGTVNHEIDFKLIDNPAYRELQRCHVEQVH